MYKKVTKRWCSIWNWNKWLDTTACNRLRSWDWRLLNPWAATHKGWVWIPHGIYDHIYLRIDHTKINYSCFRKMDLFGNGSIWQHSFWRCRKKTDERISENNGLFATLTRLMFKLELKWPQNLYLNMRYPQIDPFPTTIVIWYMHIFKDIYVYVYIYQWYSFTNKSRCLETWPKLIVHNISFHPPLRPKPRCECLWLGGMAWVSPVPRIPGSGSQVTLRKKPTGIWLFIQRHHEILYILQ